MRNKELIIRFTNWELDDIVVELARHIEKGYRIATYSTNCSYHEFEVEATLLYRGKGE